MTKQEDTVEYYKLIKVKTSPQGEFLATAAVITCGLCGDMIDGMGGPSNGSICLSCGDALKAGMLKGCVKRA